MKILIASDSYKHQVNGIASSVTLLTDLLRERGHEVKTLSLSNTHTSYKDGDDYFISSFSSLVYPDLRVSVKFRDPLLDELMDWKPDIAHIHTEFSARRYALKVIADRNIPFVMTSHTNYEDYIRPWIISSRLAKRLTAAFDRKIYDKADCLIVPSGKVEEYIQDYGVNCPIAVIPNGIDLKVYPFEVDSKSQLLEELGLTPENKILVEVSRISREKNIDELIEYMPAVLQRDPSVKLLIVGDGPHREKLEKKAKTLEFTSSVIFTGMIPSDELYRYYQLGDIFVCASTFETQGLTYVEAMANGLPLVCREDKCLENIIDQGENGYTYTTEEEYVKYLFKILNDRDLQKKMSAYSQRKSMNFRKERFVESVEELYFNVIHNAMKNQSKG